VSDFEFARHVRARADRFGLQITDVHASQFERYYALLSKWNRRINLTALPLDASPSSETLDRLFVEPMIAVELVADTPLIALDLGSGAGSPAIPLKVLRPAMSLTLVEVRARKAAFLREVVRSLELEDVDVQPVRFQSLSTSQAVADLITVRAVRADEELLNFVRSWLRPAGQLLLFGAVAAPDGFVSVARVQLPNGSLLLSCKQRSVQVAR